MTSLPSRTTSGLRPPVAPRAGRGSRIALIPSLALSFAVLSGCGARSDLTGASAAGTGGAGGTTATGSGGDTGGTTTTSASTTTSAPSCSSLVVQPTAVYPELQDALSTLRTALLPSGSDIVISARVSEPGQPTTELRANTLDAFESWPPSFAGVTYVDSDVSDYAIGPGPQGPVALTEHVGAGGVLFESFYPEPTPFDVPIDELDHILFTMAIEGRYFYAGVDSTPGYEVLSVGSYQPNGLPQSEQPLVCTKSPLLGAAVPSGQGFLAVYTEPAQVGGACVPDDPAPGTLMALHRYDSPPDAGSFLQHTEGAKLTAVTPEPIVHLGLSPASFGAWLVYQSDGSTAEVPPPIFGLKVDGNGQPLDPPVSYGVSPGGYISPEMAVASLGDTLAVAWVEAIDPSAPVILVQLLHPDGTLGPSVSIPTNDAWLSSDLRLLASADATHLLLSWLGPPIEGTTALARIDCIQ